MTDDPKPIFTTDEELNTLIEPDGTVTLGNYDESFQVEFSLEGGVAYDNEAMAVRVRYTFPNDQGHFETSDVLDSDQTEGLYRLARVAVLNQLRKEDLAYAKEHADKLRLAELPRVGRLENAIFPEPTPDPWILEPMTRRKILDWRALGEEQAYHGREVMRYVVNDKEGKRPEWLYFTAPRVHLTTCKKAIDGTFAGKASNYDRSIVGRLVTPGDITPEVRTGRMAPQFCTVCKPLGKYTALANATYPAPEPTPPDNMPDNLYGYDTPITDRYRQGMWNRLIAMDRKRWAALADAIEWAAAENDDAPAAEYEA